MSTLHFQPGWTRSSWPAHGASRIGESAAEWRPARRQSFLSDAWLDADLPPLPARELAAAGLHQLRRSAALMAQLDLHLARELRAFLARGGVKQVGHSRAEDFCLERLGVSGAHAQELMLIEKRLGDLPAARAALVAGALSRSKIREIVRVATPETDSAWASFARGRSVRELKVAAKRWKQSDGATAPVDDVTDDETSRIRWRCTEMEAGIWRGWGRGMMRDLLGRAVSDAEMAEALAAETLSGSDEGGSDEAGSDGIASAGTALTSHGSRARGRRHGRMRPSVLRRHERRRRVFDVPGLPPLPTSVGAADAWEHLRVLRHVQRLRHGLACERARILSRFLGRQLHRVLGLSHHHFCEYALGLCLKDVDRDLRLQSSILLLPKLADAWHEGALSEREVRILARIATRETEEAWIAHAGRCTRARLEEEVRWHLAVRAVLPWPTYLDGTGGVPEPSPMPKARFALDWRTLFGLREPDDTEMDEHADAAPGGLAVGLRRVTIVIHAAPAVAELWWRALCDTRRRLGAAASDAECVHQMLLAVARSHHGADAEARVAEHAILERDGWCCAMPHCRSRRALHVHHVVFRSRGGGDESWNLVTLCEGCHRLLHEGFVTLEGRAPAGLLLSIGPIDAARGARELWKGGIRQ